MLREIDNDNLKMKHLINVKTDADVTAEDFLFEIFQAFEEKNWPLDGKGRTIPQLKWAGLRAPILGMSLEESMTEIEKLGWIKISAKNGTQYHEIVNHPW